MPREMTINKLLALSYQDEIEDSQDEPNFHINGIAFARIRYGKESTILVMPKRCKNCGVEKGQIHVMGCGTERCPKCNGHLWRCGCQFDELEEA